MSHHSITYNDVVKKMDTIKYEDRAKLNIASKGRDEVEEQDIIRWYVNGDGSFWQPQKTTGFFCSFFIVNKKI